MLEIGDFCPLCGLLISGVAAALDESSANIVRYLAAMKEAVVASKFTS